MELFEGFDCSRVMPSAERMAFVFLPNPARDPDCAPDPGEEGGGKRSLVAKVTSGLPGK